MVLILESRYMPRVDKLHDGSNLCVNRVKVANNIHSRHRILAPEPWLPELATAFKESEVSI